MGELSVIVTPTLCFLTGLRPNEATLTHVSGARLEAIRSDHIHRFEESLRRQADEPPRPTTSACKVGICRHPQGVNERV